MGEFECTSCLQKAIPEPISWYRQGEEIFWEPQSDVFTFRMVGGVEYVKPQDDTSIDKVIYYPTSTKQKNELRFKPSTTDAQREVIKDNIRNLPSFEREMQVVTRVNQGHHAEKFINLSTLIFVYFDDPNISYSDVIDFSIYHDVNIVRQPPSTLREGARGFYIFEIKDAAVSRRSSDVAKEMWEEDGDIIFAVEPDMMMRFTSNSTSCPLDDEYSKDGDLWHIKNDGSLVNKVSSLATENADAKVCDCWEDGFDGKGTKIAVVEWDGFDQKHEDIKLTFV